MAIGRALVAAAWCVVISSWIDSSEQVVDLDPELPLGVFSVCGGSAGEAGAGHAKTRVPVRICALASTQASTSERLYNTVRGVGL